METGYLVLVPAEPARSDTKYRDIADGNCRRKLLRYLPLLSDTKYRDIADGNSQGISLLRCEKTESDTKYRDIADGNHEYPPLQRGR